MDNEYIESTTAFGDCQLLCFVLIRPSDLGLSTIPERR